jgi:hypothetical protein
VSVSLAPVIVGHDVPAPVPATSNFINASLTGLLSTTRRVAAPFVTVGFPWSIQVSPDGANVKELMPPPLTVVALTLLLAGDRLPAASTAFTV